MITEIKLKNIATFKDEQTINANKINYIYGGNGSGKTTISRLLNCLEDIANSDFKDCNIVPTNILDDSEILVYNTDFIKNNFDENSELKGIFTLGKENINLEKEINLLQGKSTIKQTEKQKEEENLDNNGKSINKNEEDMQKFCWDKKTELNLDSNIFQGGGNNKKKFAELVLEKYHNSFKNKEIDIKNIDELQEKYNKLFKEELKEYSKIPLINNIDISKIQNVLQEKIVSTSTSQMKELIEKLSITDWVKKGTDLLDDIDKCPFCQQTIDENRKNELKKVFDETYQNKVNEFENEVKNYQSKTQNLLQNLKNIIELDIPIIKFDELNSKIKLLESIADNNNKEIENKGNNLSNSFEISDFASNLEEINKIITELNRTIETNNNLKKNQVSEQKQVIIDYQMYFINTLKNIIEQFEIQKQKLLTEKNVIEEKLKQIKSNISEYTKQISEKQEKITSIEPTIREINKLLKSLCFNNFKLVEQDNKYQIVREDGTPVNETLSEGEKRFLTFIYFYNLIKGSHTKASGSVKGKIIVIDDPICSLDSTVLYVVITLISNIQKAIKDDNIVDNIKAKQLFILTHNTYFYNEIKYKVKKENCSYLLVFKDNNESKIKQIDSADITSSYNALWEVVKNYNADANLKDKISLCNNMRRIIEKFFTFIDKNKTDQLQETKNKILENMTDNTEKNVINSLFKYLDDNSHNINDDLEIYQDEVTTTKYIELFKKVFDKTGYISHYNSMMGIEQ